MLFQTGYQPDPGLIEYFIRYREKISGVYFPYPGFTTGRGEVAENCKEQLEKDLAALSAAGIKLCLLLNGNCYGKDSLMPEFFQSIGNTVEKLAAEFPDLVIGKISVEDAENVQLAASLGVNAIPALFFYRNGKLEKQLTGFMTKDQLKAQLGL